MDRQSPAPAAPKPLSEEQRRKIAGRMTVTRGLISIAIVLVVWELCVFIFRPSPLLLVAPSAIGRAFWEDLTGGVLLRAMLISAPQFGLGFAIAVVVGVGLGLCTGLSGRIAAYVHPWVTFLYATPTIALAPIIVILLGLDLISHVAVVALTAFFPIIFNTNDAVRAVQRDLREVGIVFQASPRETFWRIALPGAIPGIFTGLRLGLGRGLVGVVVADLFGSEGGIGYLIINATESLATARIYVAAGLLAALGLVFTGGLRVLQIKLTPWDRPLY